MKQKLTYNETRCSVFRSSVYDIFKGRTVFIYGRSSDMVIGGVHLKITDIYR